MERFIEVNNMKNKILILILGLFMISNVLALGITPGRTTIDFEPNLVRDVKFSIVNTESKDMDIAFSVEGALADYISISSDVASIGSDEGSKEFGYTLTLPRGLAPGLHKADVIALEVPRGGAEDGTVVRATVSVVTQVYVYVPYPGKFLEASLDIVSKDEENTIDFYVPFISRGEESVLSIKGAIDIYKGDEKIFSLDTNELSASVGDRKELRATWNPGVAPGEYRAAVSVNYDGEILKLEKEFNVGPEDFGVLGISVNDFKLGDVARIKILVQNKLSDDVSGAFADLSVYDSDLGEIASLTSENYDVPAESNKEMIIFWDTERLDKGQYGSELDINYNDRFVSKNFRVDVSEDAMLFSGVGFVISDGVGEVRSTTILIIVIVFLVLVNLVWLLWWLRHKKK